MRPDRRDGPRQDRRPGHTGLDRLRPRRAADGHLHGRQRDLDGLRAVAGVEGVERHGAQVRVSGTGPLLAHVAAHLMASGRAPLDLRVQLPTLDDRFVALTQEIQP